MEHEAPRNPKKDPCRDIDPPRLFLGAWLFTAIALTLAFDKLYEGSILLGTLAIGMALYFHMCTGKPQPAPSKGASQPTDKPSVQQLANMISLIINIINIIVSIALLLK